ncbi:hypothetical protein M885DRAFT_546156 [Pelagophyceae sp. CCMP2097]|nr:hypothetical protein M885DRAFT_546156 [Pelagophyceae sp. CCMP2097]
MAAVRAAAAVRARARAAADLDVPETLRAAYTLPRFWSAARCGQVLDALHAEVARRADDHGDGWSDGRHRAFATNDLPVALVPQIDALCRAWLRADVFPHLVRRHGWGSTDRLDFRDLFFVRYSASPGRQRGLPLHRDGSVVSFNVLLSDPQSFQGGGTYVEADNCVYAIGRGDVFVHAGKLRHGAAPVTAGERIVLVAFVDVAPTADAAPDTPPS